MPNALIALSGGVDSSVAACLMQEAGFSCTGAIMRLYPSDTDMNGIRDARQVARRLKMPFYVFSCAEAFANCVIAPFIHDYEAGSTPNPCITCNRTMKFGYFFDRADALGCASVATGHYARVEFDDKTGRFLLKKAVCAEKDQSYFLYFLTQSRLARLRFPLGALTKEESRRIAEQRGLITAHKSDSQDICFVPDGDYAGFMERYTAKQYRPGNYLDQAGNIVGTHQGAVRYTIGQRKGLRLAMGEPVYVCAKDMAANTVTVGPNEALFSRALIASGWNWIAIEELTRPLRVCAKIRSRHAEQPATVYPMPGGAARVEFDEPQRAICPGQAVVLYDGDTVLGGGTIQGATT